MTEDKRARNRVDYKMETRFTTSGGKTLTCTLHDISMSGFFLQTDELLSVGSKGTIQMTLQMGEDVKEVKAQCLVTRCLERKNESGCALQIIHIDPDSSINLYNMIKFQSV